ncbi:MAG: glycosyltransferase family 39 protein [Acidobacteriales bacterium]|nr:glycosyltransferase family 39 protein [Terriglobales bacterium]
MLRSTSRAYWLAVPCLCALYFWRLDGMGVAGPDEPRYAAIGREMARSGDWVTPRLWGEPWFEKPALLYWMTGVGFMAGLGAELAPRVPVALFSVAFLVFFFWILRREFGETAAAYATAILATCAGWLAFSRVAVTDLPMAAAFSAAMLMSLRWLETGDRKRLPVVAGLLGIAVLAKGMVPLVLALPLIWMGRKRWMDWLRPPVAAAFLLVAVPWYLLCYVKNGWPFLQKLFWEQQLLRFGSSALQHEQPFWFYLPVLLAALFPWIPALAGLFNKELYRDRRSRFLLAWALFGLLFFSLAVNKLPGYVLPLTPAVAALLGRALSEMRDTKWVLGSTAILLVCIPFVAVILPGALAGGLSSVALDGSQYQWLWLAPVVAAAAVWQLARIGKRAAAFGLTVAAVAVGILYLERQAIPLIDTLATARPLWRQVEPVRERVCIAELNRSLRYGLNYYSLTPIPDCAAHSTELQIRGLLLYPRTE